MSDIIGTRGGGVSGATMLLDDNASTENSQQQSGSLNDQFAVFKQQIDDIAPGPYKDQMLQAYQSIASAVDKFEGHYDKTRSYDAEGVERPWPDELMNQLQKAASDLAQSVARSDDLGNQLQQATSGLSRNIRASTVNGDNLHNALKQSQSDAETANSALRQFQVANSLYSQQSSAVQTRIERAAIPPTNPWPPGGDFNMFWQMQDQIGQINEQYVKAYQHIMGGQEPPLTPVTNGYAKFFTDLSNAMGLKTQYLSAGSTTGNINFDYPAFKTAFDSAMAAYTGTIPNHTPATPGYLLTEIQYYSYASPADKAATLAYWQQNLGQGFVVFDDGGVIKVYADTTIVVDMSNSIDLKDGSGNPQPQDMLQQIYSSWETSFNGNQNTVSTTVQRIGDLYSSTNRTFDNLTKIMSSAFQSCVDCAKDFLRI